MIRIYYRVSTDKQEFRMQQEAIQELCRSQGFDYNACVQYTDFAITGTIPDRNQYQKLLSDLQDFDTILVYEFSRLWRDMAEQAPITKKFRQRNITVLSPRDGRLDKNTDMFLTNIRGCVNEMEAERTKQRVIDGIAAKKIRVSQGLEEWKGRGQDKTKRKTEGYKLRWAKYREQKNLASLKKGGPETEDKNIKVKKTKAEATGNIY